MSGSLAGRVAVVTGVSRQRGIGFAIASRLIEMGASVFVQHWNPHDVGQPWGGDDIEVVLSRLRERLQDGARLGDVSPDLSAADAADDLIAAAASELGHLDILVCNHARSGGDGTLAEQSAATLDAHWQVNARSTLLATRAFAAQQDGREGGRVIWMTSGQGEGPMSEEIAYATSKAALAGITPSVADDLISQGIVLNTVNPGPVNTGYLDEGTSDRPDQLDSLRTRFPVADSGPLTTRRGSSLGSCRTRGTGLSDRSSAPRVDSAGIPIEVRKRVDPRAGMPNSGQWLAWESSCRSAMSMSSCAMS